MYTFDGTIFYDQVGNPLGNGTDAISNDPTLKAQLNAAITAWNTATGGSYPLFS